MKAFKQITVLMAIVLMATSCEDFLTVRPENNQSSDQFWNTKEEVEAVLGAGYYDLRSCVESFFLWGEARGNMIELGNDGTDLQKAARSLRALTILPTNNLAKWDKLYSVINMANSVLVYGPTVVNKDATFDINVMNSFASEAYFQRALAYYYLVRLWKDVPFITTPYVDDSEKYTLPQTDGQVILERCLTDLYNALETAKEKFPESSIESSANSKGRATRWAIYALIADINLWLENYDACLEACDAVINSGYVGLIGSNKEQDESHLWFTNFFPGNSNESIFEIQYSYLNAQTNSFINWFDVSMNYYISDYGISLFSLNPTDVRGEKGSYEVKNGKLWKFIGIDESTARNSGTQNDQNWIVYRLADIILMKAECYIMKGTDDDFNLAVEHINQIRERSGISTTAGSSNPVEMMKLLLEERHREFVGEGKNWFDILRIGLKDMDGAKNLLIEQVLEVSSPSSANAIRAKLNDPDSWYLPVHANELNNNYDLIQNPYYDIFGN